MKMGGCSMRKRMIAIVLMMVMTFNIICCERVNAAVINQNMSEDNRESISQEKNLKYNYNFINTIDFDNIHYTYMEDGITYSVYESANEEFSEIYTQIYRIEDKEEIFIEEFVTYIEVNDGYMDITKYNNEIIIDTRRIDIQNERLEENSTIMPRAGRPYDGMLYYDGSTGKYYTGWYYDYSNTGSNLFQELTYTAIIKVLKYIVGVNVVTEILAEAAETILDENIERVYWKQEVYHVNEVSYPARELYGSFIGQRIYTDFYSDKAMKNYINSEMSEWHDSIEWPSRITIGPA